MILEMSWDNLWTLSFRLSQFYGHGSWLVCEVALSEGGLTMHVGISEGDTKFLYAMKLVSLTDIGSIVHLSIIH